MTVRALCALVGVSLFAACAPPPSVVETDAGTSTDGARSADASTDARDAFVVVMQDTGTLDDAAALVDAATLDDAGSAPDAYVDLADSGIDAYVAPMDAASSPDAYVAPIDAAVPRDAFAGPDAYVAPTPTEISEWNTLLARAETDRAARSVPGVSIAVVLHGRLAFAAGIGLRDVASSLPVTTSTLFHADSMSKMVLAATAMSLARDGLLDIHAPITNYIPWFTLASGYDASTITTEQLLTHTSGFPCDTIVQCGSAATLGPRETFFRGYPQPLWAPPGAVWDYSNTGYALASQVLVAAAGVPDPAFEQLVHDRVFVPGGMTTATYDAAAAMLLDHTTQYILNASGGVITTRTLAQGDCDLLHPSGGVISTPTDYAHLVERFLAGDSALLDAAEVAAMEAPHVSTRGAPTQAYGYGLVNEHSPYPAHGSIWHDGDGPGSIDLTYIVPDRQFAIVIMANASGGPMGPVTWRIATDALQLFLPDAFSIPSGVTSSATWGPYTGTYNDTTGTLGAGVVISLVSGALHISAPNATDNFGHVVPINGAMSQSAVDQFLFPDGATLATFFPDATGTFRYLVTRRGVAIRP